MVTTVANNLHQFACEMADGNLLVMIHKREETRKQLITGRGTVSFQQVMLFHLMRRRDGRGLVRFRFNSDSTSFIRVLRSSQVGWIDCVNIHGGTEDS